MLRELRDCHDRANLDCDVHCSACGRKELIAAGSVDVSVAARLDLFDSPNTTISSAKVVALQDKMRDKDRTVHSSL